RKIELRAHGVEIVIEDVLLGDAPALAMIGAAEVLRDRGVHLGERRTAVPRLELQTVVLRRIVARGDDDAAEDLAVKCGERDVLRRCGAVREKDAPAAVA